MQRKEMRSAVYWLWKASLLRFCRLGGDSSAGRAFFRPDERLRLEMGSLVKKIHRERQRTVLPAGLDAGEDGRKKEINEDSGIRKEQRICSGPGGSAKSSALFQCF